MGGLLLKVQGFRREAVEGRREKYTSHLAFEPSQPKGSDSAAFLQHFVTITPIRLDRTDRRTLRALQKWDLGLPRKGPAQQSKALKAPTP